jgi:preprotein translocase subunit YajC
MTGEGGASGLVGFFLPLVAMFLLFWALLIRPQQKQQKQHREMLAQLKRGDAVVTSGGVHGTVVGIADDVLTVEISPAPQVRIRVDRSAVSRRAAGAEDKNEKKEKEARK